MTAPEITRPGLRRRFDDLGEVLSLLHTRIRLVRKGQQENATLDYAAYCGLKSTPAPVSAESLQDFLAEIEDEVGDMLTAHWKGPHAYDPDQEK